MGDPRLLQRAVEGRCGPLFLLMKPRRENGRCRVTVDPEHAAARVFFLRAEIRRPPPPDLSFEMRGAFSSIPNATQKQRGVILRQLDFTFVQVCEFMLLIP